MEKDIDERHPMSTETNKMLENFGEVLTAV
jgi:hypothetical protein